MGIAARHAGSKGIYVTNDGGTSNAYTITTSQKSFTYTTASYTIPAGSACAFLSFWYMGNGEVSYDYMQVYLTTVAPTAGELPPAGATQLGGINYGMTAAWTQVVLPIPASLYGTAQQVMVYWINDASVGTQAPIAIDDVQLYYSATGPVNDNCAGAISLPVGVFGTCTTTTGDIGCASNSGVVTPTDTAADDLWYSFVATSTVHTVNVGATSINPVIEVFSGTCGSLTSIANARVLLM